MKKLLAICLSVLLICAAMPFAFATAAEDPTIVVSEVEGKAGETVSVTVSMKNNPGIVSTKVKVGYDATALEFVSKEIGDFSASGYSWGQDTKNPFVINWCDAINPDSTAELLATLTFKIKDDAAAGTYPLTLEYDNEGDIYNANWDTVVFGADEGAVTVVADAPTYEIPETPEGALYFAHFQTGDLTGWQSGCSLEVVPENDGLAMKWDASGADWANMYNYSTNVAKNADYILIMDVKADRNTNMNLKVLKGDWSADAFKTTFNVTTEWQTVTVPFSTNEGSFLLLSSNTTKANGATYYLDNITVIKAPETPVEPDPELPVEGNLIVNGTFEDGNADGWSTHQGSAVSKDAAKNGTYGINAIGNGGWGGMFNQTVAVEAGKSYKLSFWVKVVSNGVNIQVKDADGNKFEGSPAGWYDANKYGEWTYVEKSFVAHADSLTFNVCGAGNGTAESAYFDSITLIKLKDPSFDGYITNGDFEMGDLTGWINLWNSCTVDFVEGYESDNAVSVTGGSWTQVRQNNIKVKPNTDYILTAWVKNAKNFALAVKTGDDSADIKTAGPLNNTEWELVTLEFNTGVDKSGNALNIDSICVLLMSWDGGGSAIVDNVSLKEKPAEPSFDGYIINGDFETGDLTGWHDNKASISDSIVHGGNYSAYSSNTTSKYEIMLRQGNFAVEPGANYTLTYWYYYDGTNAEPSFYTYIKNGNTNVASLTTYPKEAKTWVKVTKDFNAGEYSEVEILLSNRAANDGGTYYFDDVKLVKVKDPSFDGYIYNGDFETGTLINWTNLWDSCTYDFVEGYESDNALSITAGSWSQIRQNGIVVEKNTDYVLTAWMKANTNFGMVVKAGDDSADIKSVLPENGTEWQKVTLEFNSGDYESICVLLIGWDGGGSAIVDNVSLAKVEAPVEPEYKDPTIVVSDAEGNAGDTVTITVSMKKNPGIVSTKVKIGYDASALELLEYALGDFSASGYSWGQLTKNPFVINWCDAINPNNTAELLATLTFKIKDTAAAGTYALTLTYDNDGDIYNSAWETVVFGADEGSITVIGGACQHEYDGACDPDCNLCGEIRDVHTGLVHFDAVEAGCHYNGNIEYWFCPDCECFWADEALTQLTNSKNVIVPAKGGEVIHFEAIAPACHYNGNIEYWFCAECEQFWADEALTQLTNSKNVILGAADHTVIHFDAVEAACHYNGNIEYWFCSVCEGFWADEALTQVTNSKNVIVPAKGGEVIHFEAIAPACHYNGNIEYWFCADCEQFWQDAALTQLTNSKNVVLPATGSENLKHVEAVAPTCSEAGNIEYWYCSDCEQFWQDEALTQLTNSKNVIIAPVDHTIVHIDAVEAGCHYNGNIEYWYCSVCEMFWQDAALTQITNSKNVIVPAKGGDVVHFEAIAPACHYNGQIEYWFCPECEQFWQDEALTQITNSKNVVLPATGSENLKHVEYKAPTATENGNIEYWYCEDCEQFWQDEALTQLTNSKNVIIPATGVVDPDSPVTGDSIVPVVVALLTLIASGVAVTVLKKRA